MVRLIRPYLKYSAYHYGLRVNLEASCVRKSIASIQEQWLRDTMLSSAWNRLYDTWDETIRIYLRDQREWNGFSDDFDWKLGNIEATELAVAFINCFGVDISTDMITEIKTKKPSFIEDYMIKSKEVEEFWYTLEKFETFRLEPYP